MKSSPGTSDSPPGSGGLEALLERFRQGDVRALGRLLTLVENQHPDAGRALAEVYPLARNAYRIGFTGAPGAGKSTLVSHAAAALAQADSPVAVLAMDPTSPFTGGALLGDRVRFQQPDSAPGGKPVFFRSAASRGHTGGLSKTTEEMSIVLDAFGYERLLIESVGVGQVGLDIADACDTTVVVVVPESGDDVQALKAGLMEIADILVINKSDRPGARTLRGHMDEAMHLRSPADDDGWTPSVLMTCGQDGEGIPELMAQIDAHREYLLGRAGIETRRRDRLRRALLNLVREELRAAAIEAFRTDTLPGGEALEEVLNDILEGRRDPFAVAHAAVRKLFG